MLSYNKYKELLRRLLAPPSMTYIIKAINGSYVGEAIIYCDAHGLYQHHVLMFNCHIKLRITTWRVTTWRVTT